MLGRRTPPRRAMAETLRRISVRAGADRSGSQRLAGALERLADSTWPEVAWGFSRLTEDGSPVEFTFSSHDEVLRCTIEAGGPELDAHDRLGAACSLLRLLDLPLPHADALESWRAMQRGMALNWGAWLGLRVSRVNFIA